ncbi:MAG TPA: hypothetical protein VF459_16895, partial [Caulobacteraceae bacterium]
MAEPPATTGPLVFTQDTQSNTAAILAAAEMVRQNDYLKLRNAQLQEDVASLAADNERLRQELERIVGRRAL